MSDRDAILAGNVHREADVYVVADDAERLPLVLGESVIQRWIAFQRFDDSPGDQVREAQLSFALQRALFIDDVPILFDDAHGNLPLEVAVGIERLAAMFSAIRAAAPRSGTSCSPVAAVSGSCLAGSFWRGCDGRRWRRAPVAGAAMAGGATRQVPVAQERVSPVRKPRRAREQLLVRHFEAGAETILSNLRRRSFGRIDTDDRVRLLTSY